MAATDVLQFYRSVIDDVVNSIRETFLDDGVDEQVLLELKQVWENKLVQSKAVPSENSVAAAAAPPPPPPPNPPASKADRTTTAPQSQQQQFTTLSASTQNQTNQQTTTVVSTTHPNQTTNVRHSSVAGGGGGGAGPPPPLQYHYTTTTGQSTGPGGTVETSKSVTFTLPQTVGGSQKPVTITLPPHLMQTGLVMSSPAAAAAQALPTNVAAGLLQNQLALNHGGVITQHQTADGSAISYQTLTAEQLAKQGYVLSVAPPQHTTTATTTATAATTGSIIQLDGANDTSDEDDDDDDFKDENDDDDEQQNEDENEGIGEEEEPLNSEDDVSDEDPSELFDTDNVIVCQYDKITRSRNKWKFHLKDGIMNLQGRDFIFQKASGDAEW